MGFNKKILPPLEKIMEIRRSYESDSQFLEGYMGRYDCLMGSRESMNYIKELEEKEKNVCSRKIAGEVQLR